MGSDTQAKFSNTVFITLDEIANPDNTYGQIVSLSFPNIDLINVYGQVVALSGIGIQLQQFASSIPGYGDVIYYGEEGNLNLNSGEFSADFVNTVFMSGMASPIVSYEDISSTSSNSVIFSASGVSILPSSSSNGLYLFFSNHNGLNFSVSGVSPIVTSNGSSNLVSISGVGSHLGLVGDGSKWIAIEENGIV